MGTAAPLAQDADPVPLATYSQIQTALTNLRDGTSRVRLVEADFGQSAAVNHHVATTFRALGLMDRAGQATATLRSLVHGTTTMADVLATTHESAVEVVLDGGPPSEFDASLVDRYGSRKSWTRFRKMLLDSLVAADPALEVSVYRRTRVTPGAEAPREGGALANELATAEARVYLAALRDAIQRGDAAAETRIRRQTARLRDELRNH